MIWLILIAVFGALVFLPQWWVRKVMQDYRIPLASLPGTGAELARHLSERFDLGVTVEISEHGDHYDPADKCVRLTRENYEGKSLTAVAVAAHEIGHAIQDHQEHPMLALRSRIARMSLLSQKFGIVIFMAMPVLTGLVRSPQAGLLLMLVAVGYLLLPVLMHLVTLPVELDASFGKALPILSKGEYISDAEKPHVEKVLRAAALTYVAASLVSILNVWRWIAILRR